MKLSVIGSSSKGNAYALTSEDGSILLLEAGVAMPKIKQSIDFHIERVVGCLVSHEHQDHAKSVSEALRFGVQVYTSQGTIEAIGAIGKPGLHAIAAGKIFPLGDFKVMPFAVKHDAAEPFGFLVYHPEMGNLLFATDTYYLPNRFARLSQVLIECNYSDEILNKNYSEGVISKKQRDRVLQSHLSLETCIEAIKANDLCLVQNIVLIHLSDQNSHAEAFRNSVEKSTGKRTIVADSGITIEINRTQF